MENKISLSTINQLLEVMARLRAPDGCPWDKEQNHLSIAKNSLEESAELIEAIEASNDEEMKEELGDLLLQIVFHCQLAQERGAFNFEDVVKCITEKLIRRHPHVFAQAHVKNVDGVWEQWEQIKKEEKAGTTMERKSALDGIPPALPALMKAQKLFKKASKAHLLEADEVPQSPIKQEEITQELCRLCALAQQNGWDAETLLRNELRKQEALYRQREASRAPKE